MVLALESKDEVGILIENLESEKERLEEMLRFPEHYKDDLRAKWDLELVNRLLGELRKILSQALAEEQLEKIKSGCVDAPELIAFFGSKLGVPNEIQEKAISIYDEAAEKGLHRGRSRRDFIAAAFFLACQIRKFPVQIPNISEIMGWDWRESKASNRRMRRRYLFLLRNLNYKIPRPDPFIWLSKFSDQLPVSAETRELATKILHEVIEAKIHTGKNIQSIAAACIYIADRQKGAKISQLLLSQAAYVTDVTIRNRYKEIARKLKIQLPKKGRW